MDEARARDLVASFKHWHHGWEIYPGVKTPGAYGCMTLLERLQLPDDMAGMRVLDIGACDGFFSLVCAERGAEVTALDYKPKSITGFRVMEEISGRTFRHVHDNIWNLPKHDLGTFDVVLFLGVLYHLPDPYRGLSIVSDHCHGDLYLETACKDVVENGRPVEAPVMQFFPRDTWKGDMTNFWRPNPAALRAMVEDCEFRIEREFVGEIRMVLHATRVDDGALRKRRRLAYGRFGD